MQLSHRNHVVETLARSGCVAPDAEADEFIRAARGDPDTLAAMVERRTHGEPVAWITGSTRFCGVEVHVAPGVYVPRWHTEPLALRAAGLLPAGGIALDLCTGGGPIAAVLAAREPSARVVATEIDPVAVQCARRNGIEVFEGFLDDPLPIELESRVDVVTAVVPYVPTGSLELLPRDVQTFEPRRALDGGVDGTDVLVEVARRGRRWLRVGGWILLELGGDQVERLRKLLERLGYARLEVVRDEEGDARAIYAQRRGTQARLNTLRGRSTA